MKETGLRETQLAGLRLIGRGKVRDIYEVDETSLLIVATDRISAFDVVMSDPIPGKGIILTQMSLFWFGLMGDIIPNHLIESNPDNYPPSCRPYGELLAGRSMLVKKARPLPIECVVRGYLSGSGWKDYRAGGAVSGIVLPPGLKESARLPRPVFTPSTKAPEGEHDRAITKEEMVEIVGPDLADRLESISISIYDRAAHWAEGRGIIIADSKFEFGLVDDKLILIDELLTPDSSRFWPANEYEPGRAQRSFDKQFLRDYLLSIKWDQKPPAPSLPREIIEKTKQRYGEALRLLIPQGN